MRHDAYKATVALALVAAIAPAAAVARRRPS
jgi:hypothetical protein